MISVAGGFLVQIIDTLCCPETESPLQEITFEFRIEKIHAKISHGPAEGQLETARA